ncbi:MAG: selenocysteine-specific translation elongation factor [Caldimicrobium sp.]|nr:selenocysteine-specific translation elongation factor [Caldimicrobium sp.]MCX7873524.1 selenocysteine-specific translation elongation factor [Caldimicrobium sp.]MDW8094697.1 selenocysteine-specific translation elongation factor [Caldimicrobium sp.]
MLHPPRSVIVGTAGHIDHGKTSLVKALTGVDTDRLKEEKERGITIDIGFANLILPSGIHVSIVDVPGHERFIRNMVAGASGIDLVLLVIAADEGIMPQTKEHLEICELLGIKEGLIVLTKIDLVDKEWLEFIQEEVKNFLKGSFLEGAPIIPFSAITLQGKEELIKILDYKAQQVALRDIDQPFRLPIDGVFTIKGFGLVVRGTSLSGKVTLNQELMVYPHKKLVKVRNIHVHGTPLTIAQAGMRVALNITGIDKEEIFRGNVIADKGCLEPSLWLDVFIKVLKDTEPPLKNMETLLLYIGTSEVSGKVILFSRDTLSAGEEDVAQLFLSKPVCVWRGDHFILRRGGTNKTVAGGFILNPLSIKRKRSQPLEKKDLRELLTSDPKKLLRHYIQKRDLFGISLKELEIHTSIFGEKLKNLLEELREEILPLRTGDEIHYFSNKALIRLKDDIMEKLRKFHESNPFSPGLTKEFLKSRLSPELNIILFEKALYDLVEEGKILKEKELYIHSQYKKDFSASFQKFKKELEEKFLKEGITPRDYEEILMESGKDYKAVLEVLKTLLREGILIKLTDKLIFHRSVLKEVEEKVREYFKDNKELSINDFRKLIGEGVSRKYIIPILEYLDKEKVTLRVGDKRVLRRR